MAEVDAEASEAERADAPEAAGEPEGVGEPEATSAQPNRILEKMLDRLFAAMVNGPSLNCRPHHSRQRVDLSALAGLRDVEPAEVLRRLLGEDRAAKVTARVPPPRKPKA